MSLPGIKWQQVIWLWQVQWVFLNCKPIQDMKWRESILSEVQSTINQHWFRNWLGERATNRYLNNDYVTYWRIYGSLGLNELTYCSVVMHIRHPSNKKYNAAVNHTLGNKLLKRSNCQHLHSSNCVWRMRYFSLYNISVYRKLAHRFIMIYLVLLHNQLLLCSIKNINIIVGAATHAETLSRLFQCQWSNSRSWGLSLWKLQRWRSLVMLGCAQAPKGIWPLAYNKRNN